MTVVIGFSLATMRLTHATIVANLTEAAAISPAASPATTSSRAVSMLKDNSGQAPLCPGNAQFEALRQTICPKLDLPAGPALESQTCDALSFAIPFTALPARIGIRLDHVPAARGCDASVACAK